MLRCKFAHCCLATSDSWITERELRSGNVIPIEWHDGWNWDPTEDDLAESLRSREASPADSLFDDMCSEAIIALTAEDLNERIGSGAGGSSLVDVEASLSQKEWKDLLDEEGCEGSSIEEE